MGGFIVCKLGVIIYGWVMVMGGGCCTCMGIAISSLVPWHLSWSCWVHLWALLVGCGCSIVPKKIGSVLFSVFKSSLVQFFAS